MKKYIIIALLFCCVAACRKKELPAFSNMPIFSFNGKIGNDNLLLEAGNDSIYMHTILKSDSNKLNIAEGIFAPENCIDCEPYLGFEFYANASSAGTYTFDPNLLIEGSNFNSYSVNAITIADTIYTIQCVPYFNSIQTSYLWLFGDGTSSTLPAPSHTYASNGRKNITLITSSFGAIDSIQQTFSLSATPFFDSITVNSLDTLTNTVIFSGGFYNTNDYSHFWQLNNDSNLNMGYSQTFLFNQFPSGTITHYTTKGSDTSISRIKLNFNSFVNNNIKPTFNIKINQTVTTTTETNINKKACIITYKKNGQVYKSFKNDINLNQANNAIFKITKAVDYLNNSNGKKTIAIDGETNCWLFNVANQNDSIKINANNIKLAVAVE